MSCEIKLFEENTDFSKLSMYKLNWDVEARGIKYDVWRVEGYNHSIGGRYGENNFWCCPVGKEPSYETMIEYNGAHAGVLWGIEIYETHNIKHKWGESSIEEGGNWAITRNGKPFFEGFHRDIDYAYIQARKTLYTLQGHALNFNERDWKEKAIGKPIYYHEEPALIDRIIEEQGCLWIVPDKKFIDKFSPAVYAIEDYLNGDEYALPDEYETGCKVEYTSPHIWWYRDLKEKKNG